MRSIEARIGRLEIHADELRQAREADAARTAHLSRAELEQLVLHEMTEYLTARSYPAPAGTISPTAIEQARQAFSRHPSCLAVLEAVVTHQENAHAPH